MPQFILDELEECARWEKIEGETRWACAHLKHVRETLSLGLELAHVTLQALGKAVLLLGR
jgi:hypothetical protein